jgi:hypothetical protein
MFTSSVSGTCWRYRSGQELGFVTTAGSPDAVREMTSAGTGGARLAPGKVEDACVSHGGEAENLVGHVCLRPLKRGKRGGG